MIDNKKLVEIHEKEKEREKPEIGARRITLNNTIKKKKKKKQCC